MAKMPEHAKLIPNPKTFAAGFYVENVFVLPGVPVFCKLCFLF